jgi:hypothetical protein
MDARDRRFTSWLGIVFGPLFVLGGFGFAFTMEGALFVWLGLSLLIGGILLRTPMPLWTACVIAASLLLALCSYTFFVYP